MTTEEAETFEAELTGDEAQRDIESAVSGRRSLARKYVMRLRRRHPDATPDEIIHLLERHYATAITTAGAVVTVGAIAAEIGIGLLPGGGAATAGAKGASKLAAKQVAKQAGKAVALGVAKSGARKGVGYLPAGDKKIQFEITALFALGIADIHGMDLDKDQSQALVYGLTNERVSQSQIAAMAEDVATVSGGGVVEVGHNIASGREDWSHWANTLADSMPAGSAQSFVRTIQTGQLDVVRQSLGGKQQAAVDYGIGAVTGGIARFVFGREVIESSHSAFGEAPDAFPVHLELSDAGDDDEAEGDHNQALAALEEAARSTGDWVTGTAGKVGSGVATATDKATRVFRSVDIDGDGIPDEAQALTAVKSVGGALAGSAAGLKGNVLGRLKKKSSD